VKRLDGKLDLVGGSNEERGEAREWLSLFWHEAVVREHSTFDYRSNSSRWVVSNLAPSGHRKSDPRPG
jgi:hypothetical protein